MIDFTNVCAVIRKYRKLRSKTQEELAVYLDISTAQYANLEKGNSLLNIEQLAIIANTLKIPVIELTTGVIEDVDILDALKTAISELDKRVTYYENKLSKE